MRSCRSLIRDLRQLTALAPAVVFVLSIAVLASPALADSLSGAQREFSISREEAADAVRSWITFCDSDDLHLFEESFLMCAAMLMGLDRMGIDRPAHLGRRVFESPTMPGVLVAEVSSGMIDDDDELIAMYRESSTPCVAFEKSFNSLYRIDYSVDNATLGIRMLQIVFLKLFFRPAPPIVAPVSSDEDRLIFAAVVVGPQDCVAAVHEADSLAKLEQNGRKVYYGGMNEDKRLWIPGGSARHSGIEERSGVFDFVRGKVTAPKVSLVKNQALLTFCLMSFGGELVDEPYSLCRYEALFEDGRLIQLRRTTLATWPSLRGPLQD